MNCKACNEEMRRAKVCPECGRFFCSADYDHHVDECMPKQLVKELRGKVSYGQERH